MVDKVKREVRSLNGSVRMRSDVDIVESALTGFVDYYDGGAIEHMQRKLDNLIRNTAEVLLALDREKVLAICEEKEESDFA